MPSSRYSQKHFDILSRLSVLPQKMIELHGNGTHSEAEFLLHELCNKDCFNVSKAAYFVDNPDFDCLKGVAGFVDHEHNGASEWNQTATFSQHLSGCAFNNVVRDLSHISYRRAHKNDNEILQHVAQMLKMNDAQCIMWQLKNDNFGLLVFQLNEKLDDDIRSTLHNGVHLFGFCPVH